MGKRITGHLAMFTLIVILLLASCSPAGSDNMASSSDVGSADMVADEASGEDVDNPEPEGETVAPADNQASAPVTSGSEAASSSTTAATEVPADEPTGLQVFQIDDTQSEVSFTIGEVLRGSPFTVVGTTSGVSGEILLDPTNPTSTQVGPIQIDARALATDSSRRDGAIRRFVLGSNDDANRFITFTPTNIDGLPAQIAVGDTLNFQMTGDLWISGVTRSETFDVTVSVDSTQQISGQGSSTILYADYGLSVPSVPFVASVEDEVGLNIEFVALAQ